MGHGGHGVVVNISISNQQSRPDKRIDQHAAHLGGPHEVSR